MTEIITEPSVMSTDGIANNNRRVAIMRILAPLAALVLALLVGAVFIAIAGVNPLNAYKELFRGAFGSWFGFTESIQKSAPLIFTGLAFAFAARCGVWNIGAEGQLYSGAIGSVLVGLALLNYPGVPMMVGLPLAILAGLVFGALWAVVPGILKAYLGISEIITTIMLNYVAIHLTGYLVHGPLIEPPGFFPETALLAESTWFPYLFGTRIHFGFPLAILVAVVLYIILWHTPFGFKVRAVGFNPAAAEYAGVNVKRFVTLTMLISGAVAGLAGSNDILGLHRRLLEQFSAGYGFNGIAVALLGQNHPIGIIFAGIVFSGLRAGAASMQRAVGVEVSLITILQGLVVLFVVAGSMMPRFISWRSVKKGE